MPSGTRSASKRQTNFQLLDLTVNDPIDSRQLQIFLRLASEGSLKKAAESLFLTTSAISHSISNLESNLSVKLFHRSGRGLILTPRGEFLAKQGGAVLAQLSSLRRQLADENLSERTTFRVAVGFSFVSFLLTDIAHEFSECFRRVTLHVQAAERAEAIRMVRNHEVMAAVLVDPPEDDGECISTTLFSDNFMLLIHQRHPLAQYERVPIRKLSEEILVTSRIASHTHQQLQEHAVKRGVRFKDTMEVGSGPAVLELVKLGTGVALVPDWMSGHLNHSALELRPVEGLDFSRTWGYYTTRAGADSLPNRSFRRLCLEQGSIFSQGAELTT